MQFMTQPLFSMYSFATSREISVIDDESYTCLAVNETVEEHLKDTVLQSSYLICNNFNVSTVLALQCLLSLHYEPNEVYSFLVFLFSAFHACRSTSHLHHEHSISGNNVVLCIYH